MKIRTGFVSNSSSTSFVCAICNEVDENESDYFCNECEKEFHSACLSDEILDKMTDDDDDKEFEEVCPICNMIVLDNEDLLRYILRLNSRKNYLKEIKEKFKTYKEFRKFLDEV